MSEKIDEFCAKLNKQLNDMDERLNAMKSNVEESRKKTEATIQAQLDKVQADFEARKSEAAAAREKMQNYIEEKKAETEAKITEWKTNRELDKLERRANDAEEYAAYLQALLDSAVFTDDFIAGEIATRASSDAEAMELAIGAEKDSILFYYEMKETMPKPAQSVVNNIITEEKSHLRQLSELKEKLAAG